MRLPVGRLAAWFEREMFLVVLFAVYLVGLTWHLPAQIASDTWMTLAYGREIVQLQFTNFALAADRRRGSTALGHVADGEHDLRSNSG